MKSKFIMPSRCVESHYNSLIQQMKENHHSLDDEIIIVGRDLKARKTTYRKELHIPYTKQEIYNLYENGLISEQTYKRKLLEIENERRRN